MYDWLEDDIVTRLAPVAGAAVEVVSLPDSQAEYDRPATKTRVTVAVSDSEPFGNIRDAGVVLQDTHVTVDVIVQASLRRGTGKVYAVARAVKLLLLGYKPEHCSRKLWFSGAKLLPGDEDTRGTYSYHLKFTTEVPAVEDFNEEVLAEAINQITVESTIGESITIDDELNGGDADDTGYDIEFDGNADD